MLYQWYELGHAAARPARAAADTYRMLWDSPLNPFTQTAFGRASSAACEVFERTTRRYGRPRFGITETEIGNKTVPVNEEIVWQKPFCKVRYFDRDIPQATKNKQPRILLVAPMSGHYATLLRGTVETFLPDHEVYITDWIDARAVPAADGEFGLGTYTDYIIDICRLFEGDVHVMAVCQPSVPVLSAVSVMEQSGDHRSPHSMILMGGPIDTRVSPTAVNNLAEERGTKWFERNVIATVPWPYPGCGRRVYPGFLQLTGFMTMNLDRHILAHKNLFMNLVKGDGDSAEKHKRFYDEYLAVMDLTAEFYLQTVETVFVNHDLPRGRLKHNGRLVKPAEVKTTAVMTVEGENDDITGLGQCEAALDLCSGLPPSMKKHYVQQGVGHYGIFNGSRFRRDAAPEMRKYIRKFDPRFAKSTRGAEIGPILIPLSDQAETGVVEEASTATSKRAGSVGFAIDRRASQRSRG